MTAKPFDLWALVLLGVALAANGVFMFADPILWFETIPGVARTGPPNIHFIRDIGVTYLGVGGLLILAARQPARRAFLAGLAGGWLALHGFVHLYELAVCISPLSTVQTDFGGVYLPAILALWLAARAYGKEA